MLSKLKGYKTILFNVIMTIVMGLRLWLPDAELPDEAAVTGAVNALDAFLTAAWGVGNMILRSVTNSPMFNKPNGATTNSPVIVGILAVFLAALVLSGCAGTRAAYQAADGINETAKVMGEHYYALVHSANVLKDEGKLTGTDLVAVQNLISQTASLVYVMAEAGDAFKAVQSADNEAALQRAMFEAAKVIDRIINALKGKGTTTGARVDDYPPSWEATLLGVT